MPTRSLPLGASSEGVAGVICGFMAQAVSREREPCMLARCVSFMLAGTWTPRDAREFESAVAEFAKVDRKLWKKVR